jgi:hypothetical protein
MNKSLTSMANNIGTRAGSTSIFQACCVVLFLFVINLFVVNIFITSVVIVIFIIPPLSSSLSPSLALCFSPSFLNIYMYVCNDTSRMNIVVCLLYIQTWRYYGNCRYRFVLSVSILCLEFDSTLHSKLTPYYAISM